MVLQSATQATLVNLVEQHITSLVREAAVVNRHSKRGGIISAGDDDDGDYSYINKNNNGSASSQAQAQAQGGQQQHKKNGNNKRRRLIHHDDVNMALSWRGSEKLYVSGVPVPDTANNNSSQQQQQSISSGNSNKTSSIPRVDLNAYLQSEMTVRPPCELGMTLHWLAVDGVSPMIPMNDVWNYADGDNNKGAAAYNYNSPPPVLLELENNNNNNGYNNKDHNNNKTRSSEDEEEESIRIRDLQHRLLSEELQLYYQRITSTINNNHNPLSSSTTIDINTALRGIRSDTGIQELVPFLSRFIANGLMSKKNLANNTNYCRTLISLFNAMLDNPSLHLDLHLHQMFTPIGTCIVAKKLSSSNDTSSSYQLREEAARCLVKACNIYGDQYTTMRPRIMKLLTQQALRMDRPLGTQYGGIVGISLFGPRAIDAFLLPLVQEYWECWEKELEALTNNNNNNTNGKKKKKKSASRDVERENELTMCQQALLNAMQIFLQNVVPGEQGKRVDVDTLVNVFGERLIPMQMEFTDYMTAVI